MVGQLDLDHEAMFLAADDQVCVAVYSAVPGSAAEDGVKLTLDDEATAALDKVSTPAPGGYPYGAFGTTQRDRRLKGGTQAQGELVAQGSDHPLGRP